MKPPTYQEIKVAKQRLLTNITEHEMFVDYGIDINTILAALEAAQAVAHKLESVAHDAVDYVGAANYLERQIEAHKMISDVVETP